MKFKQFEKLVKSFTNKKYIFYLGVAIASAITSYARIGMIPFKLDDGVCYTDTDSIFTTTPIDNSLIGPELGKMEDDKVRFLHPNKKYIFYLGQLYI